MLFKTKISLCLFILTVAVIASAGLLYWGTGRAAYNLERSHLASEELAVYLSLSAETYRVFKQIRRDMMDGSGEPRFDLQVAKGRFEHELTQLKTEIERELALPARHNEDNRELQRLADLTTEIDAALNEVTTAQELLRAGQRGEALALLSATLETRIDGRVSNIIDAGLIDEREEVAEAKAEADALIRKLRQVATLTALLAAVFTIGATWFLLRYLRGPLEALSEGTSRIAAGHLDHRIHLPGRDEFAALAQRFNSMAVDLKRQHQALESARDSLEKTVAQRTDELRQSNKRLENRDEMRRQFFADVGHELRTPITIIRGEAEVALRSRKEREQVYGAALKRIVDVTSQLTHLVNDLFLMARSQAGTVDMRKEAVRLNDLVLAVTEEMRTSALERDADLESDLPDTPVMVRGDTARLRQLLVILIDNALQHGQTGIRVCTGLAVAKNAVTLSVSDTGPGITEPDLDSVFERFYRGNKAAQRSAGGTGLGLPIAKTIVTAHGGQITVESKLGAGTTFRIQMPACSQNLQLVEAP